MNLQQLLLFGLILCSVHLRAQDTLILHQELERFSTDDRKVQYLEERIKELYRSEPQAAIQYANLADSLLANMDTIAWRIELMIPKAIAYRAIGNNLRALNLLEQALSFINPSDTSLVLTKYRARIYYNQGIIERRSGNIPESISLGLMSLGILDSLLQYYPSDNRLCRIKASVLEGLGNTHGIAHHYQESLTYFRQSLAIHLLLDSRNGIASALHNIGAVMYEIDNLDSAEYYFTQSIQYTDTVHRPNLLRNYYHNMAAIAVDRENWESAISFFQKSLQMYELNRNYDGMAHVHESMAYAYIQMKDYQKAKIEALIADSLVQDDLEAKVSIQDDFVNIYAATGHPEKALHHHEQYILLKDSLISMEKDRAIAEMEAKYQHEQQEKELAIQQQEIELLNRSNQIQKLERNLLAAGLLLLLISGFLVTRIQYQKVQRKREQLKNSRALLASIKENAYLKEQRLLQELEHRNQQLTSYTLNFVQKNELMHNLRDQVEELQKQKQWSSRDFRRLKMHIQQHVSIDQDWENFRLHFESVHPDFFHNLTTSFPDLGPKELKLCALVRLNMSIKESATVLGISPDSVKTARHRLRKKMKLDHAASMLEVLMQVEKGKISAALQKAS